MHIEEIKEVKTTQTNHIFKCDNCNADLGTSIEYDDGYYEEYGLRLMSNLLQDLINEIPKTQKKNIYLCDNCYNNFTKELKEYFYKLIHKYQQKI